MVFLNNLTGWQVTAYILGDYGNLVLFCELELACGYGGSVGAIKNVDKTGMPEEEMAELVAKWREASPHIVALWKSLEDSAIRCIKRGKPTISTVGHIRFDMEDGVLWMTLPSGGADRLDEGPAGREPGDAAGGHDDRPGRDRQGLYRRPDQSIS